MFRSSCYQTMGSLRGIVLAALASASVALWPSSAAGADSVPHPDGFIYGIARLPAGGLAPVGTAVEARTSGGDVVGSGSVTNAAGLYYVRVRLAKRLRPMGSVPAGRAPVDESVLLFLDGQQAAQVTLVTGSEVVEQNLGGELNVAAVVSAGLPGNSTSEGRACLSASIDSTDAVVATLASVYSFPVGGFTIDECTLNPAIAPGTPADKSLIVSDLGGGRTQVSVGGNSNELPEDTALFSCTIRIPQGVAAGIYDVANDPSATATGGGGLGVSGSMGSLRVTQCDADCDGSAAVDIAELTLAGNLFLGRSLCDRALPSLSCPAADGDNNGEVDIAEVIVAGNRFLGGCGP